MADGAAIELGKWVSSPGNPAVHADESAALIEGLDTALKFDAYVDPEGKPIETLMREQGRFAGAHFPLSLQAVICKRNQAVCSVAKDGSLVWTNKAGDSIYLPRIQFTPVVTFIGVEKLAGQPVDDLWSQDLDCSALGYDCMTGVNVFNEDNLAKQTALSGEVVVPQVAYEVSVTDANLTAEATMKWMKDGPGAVVPTDVEVKFITGGSASHYSAYPGGWDDDAQRQMLDLIAFPFSQLLDIPQQFRQPVTIGVADTWFESKHCEFGDRVVVIDNVPPSATNDGADCGASFDQPNAVYDHATHVVGLIAAKADGKGVDGLNPFANVVFRMIDLDAFRDPAGRTAISNGLLKDVVDHNIDVFNFSWGYQNSSIGLDPIAKAISDVMRSSLIVAAAGNENEVFELGTCPILPACLTEADNVITVVGLDRNLVRPAFWKEGARGSNRNRDFHIAAIAAEVVSTVSGNKTGILSGTSQAAPQVTATAAYIISAFRDHFGDEPLPPLRVKNRLIYTSDPFSGLVSSLVGGRLNMSRALDIGVDQLVLRNAPDEVLRGRLSVFAGSGPLELKCTDVFKNVSSFIPRGKLVRLAEVAGLEGSVILYVRDDLDEPVRRVGPCELETLSPSLEFVEVGDGPEDARTRPLQVRDILDFTARMQ